ncbi:hypothetical protein TNCV_5042671 [Trichonephila clavipes]|nr:hypothetical protein TNCV_5042671 [Trichonephila clavipes]
MKNHIFFSNYRYNRTHSRDGCSKKIIRSFVIHMDSPLLRRYCHRTSALFGEINWGRSYLRRSEKLTCHCGILRARACQDRRDAHHLLLNSLFFRTGQMRYWCYSNQMDQQPRKCIPISILKRNGTASVLKVFENKTLRGILCSFSLLALAHATTQCNFRFIFVVDDDDDVSQGRASQPEKQKQKQKDGAAALSVNYYVRKD